MFGFAVDGMDYPRGVLSCFRLLVVPAHDDAITRRSATIQQHTSTTASRRSVRAVVVAPYDERSDVPGLVKQAQRALLLHPEHVAATQSGAETIKRLLGNLSQVAVGAGSVGLCR